MQELNSGMAKLSVLCLQGDMPLMATTPFFIRSEILVEGIGMQEEELHSGVTQISPALRFPTLVSLNHMCSSLYLLKSRSPLGNSLL